MATTDMEPLSPQSTRSLSQSVLGLRAHKTSSLSAQSLRSNDDATPSRRNSIRSSIDSTMDRLRSRANSEQAERGSFSKLLPIKKDRRRRRSRRDKENDTQSSTEESLRGRSLEPRLDSTQGSAVVDDVSEGNKSSSSLMTYDESEVDTSPTRPTITPHDSHSGYLTLSSPLINVSSHPDETQAPAPSGETENDSAVNTLELPAPVQSPATLAAPKSGSRSRSVSPLGKIRTAFSSSKGISSTQSSPDRASVKSSGSGKESAKRISTFFASRSRRNSVDSRTTSKPEESTTLIPTTEDPTSPSKEPSKQAPKERAGPTPLPQLSISAGKTLIKDAPATTITPPTPTDPRILPSPPTSPSKEPSKPAIQVTSPRYSGLGSNPNIVTSPSGNMISHRRVRSASAANHPSKLSHSITPLTPTVEEPLTPGGSLSPSAGAGGFFSTMFTAAQNAATSLTNSLSNTSVAQQSPSRGRAGTPVAESPPILESKEETLVPGEKGEGSPTDEPVPEPKKLAVETLGMGDLSLSHLGIPVDLAPPANDTTPSGKTERTSISPKRGRSRTTTQIEDSLRRGHDHSAGRAIAAAYAASVDSAPVARPRSLHEQSLAGADGASLNGSEQDNESVIRRTGSVRSRMAGRNRKSSAATNTTSSTAVGGVNPAASASLPRLTGFAVASKKRNRDFHQLFRSVPEDDYLIEDYSCALQREILLSGRLYVSEGHICFSSNILGWVTTLVISFDEVMSVEKKSTAMIFPNAIVVQTLHARNVFASLLSRDATYDLLVGIWKISHPSLRSSLNGVRLEEAGGGDKTEKAEASPSEVGSIEMDDEDEEEVYDEDADDDGLGSFTEPGDGSVIGSENGDGKVLSRKTSMNIGASAGGTTNGAQTNGDTTVSANGLAGGNDFPGPASHAPTECGDQDSHYDKTVKDEVIPAPIGKVYTMMFGPSSGAFMSKWLTEDQKVLELQLDDDQKGLTDDNRTRTYSYIKPLTASIGPKQTKCIITETLDALDLEKAVSVTVATQTPDVPSGNVFSVKTKYCLSWAPGNSTRLVMNCTIEWTGKSWLKGPIEKGASDGQMTYAKDLFAALRAAVSSRSRAGTMTLKPKGKKGRKRPAAEAAIVAAAAKEAEAAAKAAKARESWGILEPLRGPLGPVVDLLKPILTGNFVLGIMFILLVMIWIRQSRLTAMTSGGVGITGLGIPERIAAYEEIWAKEEGELWNWLEDRVGLADIAAPVMAGRRDNEDDKQSKTNKYREGLSRGNELAARLAAERMREREVDDAIRITEERLRTLKDVVERKRAMRKQSEQPGAKQASKSQKTHLTV
ncbi:hypothetical protein L228DRAFT_247204 [Xylona heveae TC161]|uniref:VASt domain-containing protein n=1 Tax=Xylona heveae (strain CBS 132557 / TC161) TaxID=1328760 RepID=A0A165GZZ7_XYLHT|nr:hypothetical protein L228DRAFT_247204 [Xylona heveae TC161]KZF22815.1 hypothetical protein L228DRAFT_247204 [Xylona heveae TC161]